MVKLDDLIFFYETLTPEDVDRFGEFYTDDAYFKDPFNEVHGIKAIQRIFRHMFKQLETPRFHIVERMADPSGQVALVWELSYWSTLLGGQQIVRGMSHLDFGPDGRVIYHRDYWDAAEELYAKVPMLGWLMRSMKRALSA